MFSLIPWRKTQNRSADLAPLAEHPLSLFRSEMGRVLDQLFNGWPTFETGQGGWGMDLDETDTEVKVRLDAPGFEPEDFDIQVRGDTLWVTAEHKQEGDSSQVERRLQRSVTLPAEVNTEAAEAIYRNGVLELRLPRVEEAKAQRIQIKGS